MNRFRKEPPAVVGRAERPARTPGPFTKSSRLVEDKVGQLELIARSLPTAKHRIEFGYLFMQLPPRERSEILKLHSASHPKTRVEEDSAELKGIISARLKSRAIVPLSERARVNKLVESIRTNAKFADADHIYVYCLARRVGFADVRVTDAVPMKPKRPGQGSLETLYISEAQVQAIARDFRAERKDMRAVTGKYTLELAAKYHDTHPRRPSDDVTPGIASATL